MTHALITPINYRPPSPFDVVYAKELIAIIHRHLRGEQRDVFEAYFDGLEVQEISDGTGFSAAQVKRLIYTSLSSIHDQLSAEIEPTSRGSARRQSYRMFFTE